jgi:hypothetical protein
VITPTTDQGATTMTTTPQTKTTVIIRTCTGRRVFWSTKATVSEKTIVAYQRVDAGPRVGTGIGTKKVTIKSKGGYLFSVGEEPVTVTYASGKTYEGTAHITLSMDHYREGQLETDSMLVVNIYLK